MKACVAAIAICLASATAAFAAELVMFEQDHCAYCERWHSEIGGIYAKTAEGQQAPLRMVNIHETFPSDLAHLKSGRFTPTFVLIDEKKQEVARIRGYPGEDFFWGLLGEMLEKLPTEGQEHSAWGAATDKTGQ